MSRARELAFVQTQLLLWVLFAVAAYLLFANLGLVAGLILVVPTLCSTWALIVMRRRYKRQFPNGRPPAG